MDLQEDVSTGLGREFAAYLLKQAHKFKVNAARAPQDGAIEAVHNLRVASRRLSEPLLVLAELGEAKKIRKIRRELRDYRRAFRRVRDLDVLAQTLDEIADAPESPDVDALREELAAQRTKAARAAAKKIDVRRLKALYNRIRELSERILTDEGSCRAACALGGLYERRARLLCELSIKDAVDGDLHPVRIAVKKMRYCAELIRKTGVSDKSALITELTTLQTVLGHWNDQLNGAHWLASFASRRGRLITSAGVCRDALRAADMLLQASFADRKRIEQRWPALIEVLEQSAESGNGFHQPAMLART